MTDGEELPGPRSVIDVQVADREDLLVAFVPDDQPARRRPGRDRRAGPHRSTGPGRRSARRSSWSGPPAAVPAPAAGAAARGGARRRADLAAGAASARSGPAQRRGAVRAALGLPVVLTDGDRDRDRHQPGPQRDRGPWPVAGAGRWPAVLDRVTVTLQLPPTGPRSADRPRSAAASRSPTAAWRPRWSSSTGPNGRRTRCAAGSSSGCASWPGAATSRPASTPASRCPTRSRRGPARPGRRRRPARWAGRSSAPPPGSGGAAPRAGCRRCRPAARASCGRRRAPGHRPVRAAGPGPSRRRPGPGR